MREKMRVAVVGGGFIGQVHIETLRRLGNVDVIALVQRSQAKEKAKQLGIPNYYNDYKEMFQKCNLDAVHICTPNDSHFEIAMTALEKGIHVYCEKPFTATVEEAEILVKKAKEENIVNAVNYHCRFYPMPNHLRNVVKEEEIGEILTIHGGYIQDWLLFDTDYSWRLHSERSGKTRVIADIGSHWFDLIEFITGEKIVEVMADFKIVHPIRKQPMASIETFSTDNQQYGYKEIPIDTEDCANVLFRFKNGAIGSSVFSQVFAGNKNNMFFHIAGSKMSASWDSEDLNDMVFGKRESGNIKLTKDPSLIHMESGQFVSYPGGHIEGFGDAFKHAFKQFYNKIEDRNKNTQFATFQSGLRGMIICDKIYESSIANTWVKI